jgi:hypothetical protein
MRGDGMRMPALLLGGGLVVGLLAQSADLLGADAQDALFSGKASVPNLLAEGLLGLVVVLGGQGAGLCGEPGRRLSRRSGLPGDLLGIGLAVLAVELLDVSPTLAVAVGTAAGMAAMTRLLLAPLLFAALLVGIPGVDAIPAAVFAGSAAWLTRTALDRRMSPDPTAG